MRAVGTPIDVGIGMMVAQGRIGVFGGQGMVDVFRGVDDAVAVRLR